MRRVNIVVLAILLQGGLFIGQINSADKTKINLEIQKVSPKKIPADSIVAKSKPSHKYLNGPFEMTIEKIPVPFLGHDIEQVYKAFAMRKNAKEKDEFETTDNYQRRLSMWATKPIFGSVCQDSLLAFVASPTIKYDADSQTLTVKIEPSNVYTILGKDDNRRWGIPIKRVSTRQKSIKQNAFGVKVQVEEFYNKRFELAINDMEEKKIFYLQINMGPVEAKAAKNKIAVLILAKPVDPYISSGATLINATFNDPTEYFSEIYYIDVNLKEIWFFNKTTGEIIERIKSE
jgi:hypothetical protein